MEPRNVPINYSVRWIFCSIEISKQFYSLFLAIGLIMLVAVVGISVIPYLGTLAVPLVSYLAGLGSMRLIDQIFKTNKATFDDYLKYTFDPVVFEKFAPFLILIALFNSVSVGLTLGKLTYVLLPWSTLGNVVTVLSMQASYMMILKPELKWDAALKAILRGSWMNILALICLFLCTGVFALGSLLMCLIGFFLYFIPMTTPLNYLVFSSIYEGRDIDQTTKEWSIKSRDVQTVAAPVDEP